MKKEKIMAAPAEQAPDPDKLQAKTFHLEISLVLILVFALFCAEMIFMDWGISKAPAVAGMVYKAVTLPSALHFITGWKGAFQIGVGIIDCIPGLALMLATAYVFSWFSKK